MKRALDPSSTRFAEGLSLGACEQFGLLAVHGAVSRIVGAALETADVSARIIGGATCAIVGAGCQATCVSA